VTEPYNMSQEQRDAATIARLTRQLDDAGKIISALVLKPRLGVNISVYIDDMTEEAKAALATTAAHQVVAVLADELNGRGELYERIAQYEQWFYNSRGRLPGDPRTMR